MNSHLWENTGAAEATRPNRIAHSLIAAHGCDDGLLIAETALAAVISSGAQAEIVRWQAVVATIKMAQAHSVRAGVIGGAE